MQTPSSAAAGDERQFTTWQAHQQAHEQHQKCIAPKEAHHAAVVVQQL
jgi:hypothetical protein